VCKLQQSYGLSDSVTTDSGEPAKDRVLISALRDRNDAFDGTKAVSILFTGVSSN
jgi:hypothetical protein